MPTLVKPEYKSETPLGSSSALSTESLPMVNSQLTRLLEQVMMLSTLSSQKLEQENMSQEVSFWT